ncbi:MAG: hypothetical protein ACKVJ1_10980 [Verrucomicrobiia bacterium]
MSGKLEWKVKGKVRIQLGSQAMGHDRRNYFVDWIPLDKDGNEQVIVKNPGFSRERVVGNINTFFRKFKTEDIVEPPYKSKHGWKVRIIEPGQTPVNGSSMGSNLEVSMPGGKFIR